MQKCRNDKKELFNDQPFQGGYNFVFIESLSPCQICSVYLLAMRNTVQTVCGHRFCEECLEYTLRKILFTLLLCSFLKIIGIMYFTVDHTEICRLAPLDNAIKSSVHELS